MKTAVLMVRVSSDEQAKGYSLDVQEENLKQYCINKKIEIIKVFREDHSAKTFNRPEFKKFILFAKANKGVINYLLFTSWDRFSRNTTDAYEMIRRLKDLGIEPQAIEQPIDFSIPEMKAMLAIYLALPEIDNDRRSIKIKGGMRGAWKAGRWTHKAPKGYKNGRDEDNKPLLIPDENAKYIKYIFREIANGKSQAYLRAELKKRGILISKTGMSDLLRNPLYMGKVYVPPEEGQLGYLVDGVHKSLISDKLFYKVLKVLNNQNEKRRKPKVTKKRIELLLRGFLICPNCGKKLTGSGSLSRNKTKYFYYHCNHCNKARIRADLANKMFEDLLCEFRFDQSYQEAYLDLVKQVHKSNISIRANEYKELNAQLTKQNQRLTKVQELLMDNQISTDDYNTMRTRTEETREQLLFRLRQAKSVNSNFEEYLESGFNLLKKIEMVYKTGDMNVKEKIIGSIFPENLIIDDEKVRTARINEVLRLILLNNKDLKKKKKGQLTNTLWLSPGVEHIGIEPMTS